MALRLMGTSAPSVAPSSSCRRNNHEWRIWMESPEKAREDMAAGVAEMHRRKQEAARLGIDPGLDGLAQYFDPKAEKIFMECRASGEPMIIFRARDILSLMVIAHYQ